MNLDDAKRLLAACAAFDNRQPSLIAARAWAKALENMPLDQDAFDAVARFYTTPPKNPGDRLWIQPHDVVTHRKTIRAERVENFVYEPPDPDESGRQYLARYRRQLDAVASGQAPAPTNAPALTGPPHPTVVQELTGAGKVIPGEAVAEETPQRGIFGVECPTCQARIGNSCRTGRLGTRRRPHRERLAAAGRPAPVPEDAAEIARRKEASRAALAALPPGTAIGPQDGLGATNYELPKEA